MAPPSLPSPAQQGPKGHSMIENGGGPLKTLCLWVDKETGNVRDANGNEYLLPITVRDLKDDWEEIITILTNGDLSDKEKRRDLQAVVEAREFVLDREPTQQIQFPGVDGTEVDVKIFRDFVVKHFRGGKPLED